MNKEENIKKYGQAIAQDIERHVSSLENRRKHQSSPGTNRMVIYLHAHAFTTCDCGKEMILVNQRYGSHMYEGGCECGKKFSLCLNKLQLIQ